MRDDAKRDTGGTRLLGSGALITGASRGIGRAIARAFAAQGARLCLVATDAKKLAELEAELRSTGAQAFSIALDVTDRAACFDAVARAQAHLGALDVLVNNAGVYKARPFLDYSAEDFQRLLDVNLFGTIHMTQAALPAMIAAGYGRVVNIASTAGKWSSRNQSAYNISKHAVVGLTRCVAVETAANGVTVNAICPGFVHTDMVEGVKRDFADLGVADPDAALKAIIATRVPLGRELETDEIAGLAVYLASRESSAMTGQSLLVDGGMVVV